MNIPKIMIAGTNSGCGKTTIAIGLMAALSKKGLKVQPFKVGPDYIDPMFHTFITGRHCRNLDSWMLQENVVRHLFLRSAVSADISIIEGVMGMYDGFGGCSKVGSTAHVSRIINSPVVLVVNGKGMSLSIAALIRGFIDFDRDTNIRGVIINNINSDNNYNHIKDIIEKNTNIKVIGYLPENSEYSLESRHLGLVPSDEVKGLKEKISFLAKQIEKTVNLELLIRLAKETPEVKPYCCSSEVEDICCYGEQSDRYSVYRGQQTAPVTQKTKTLTEGRVRIAVARDKAFNFYYQDNLDLLETLGAEIIFFSPVNDSELPDDIHGLYIGGGYPEVFAKELQDNVPMKSDISKNIKKGLPVYAECGGLIYMSESFKNMKGGKYKMVGAIPAEIEMTSHLQRFGYVEISITDNCVTARKGFAVRAHEFHYSRMSMRKPITSCYNVEKLKPSVKRLSWDCGFKINNLLAGYPHIHFWANINFAREFIKNSNIFKGEGI